jgi:hypothetical protein
MNDTTEEIKTEKFSKKKGRPKEYFDDCVDMVLKHTHITTRRGARNELSSGSAAVNLLDTGDPKYNYLLKPKMKRTILAQLGRISDKKLMFLVADRICEEKANTVQSVAYIRDLFKTCKPADEYSLEKQLLRTINEYCRQHEDMTQPMVMDVLERVSKVVQGSKPF